MDKPASAGFFMRRADHENGPATVHPRSIMPTVTSITVQVDFSKAVY